MSKRVLVIIRIEGQDDIVLRQEELANDTKLLLMRDVQVLVNELDHAIAKLNQILENNNV